MSSSLLRRGGSGGGGSLLRGGRSGGYSAPPKKKGGGGGFFGSVTHGIGVGLSPVTHLGQDVGKFALGFGPGAYKTGKAAGLDAAAIIEHPFSGPAQKKAGRGHFRKEVLTPLAKSYEQTYGPLTHGDVSHFLHNVYEHPLGPILDVATVVTLGGAGVAKLGKAAATVGAVSKTSKLAKLGEAGTIELKGPRALAGQEAPSAFRPTSRNPTIRARQGGIDKALKRFPAETRFVGEIHRFARELPRMAKQDKLRYIGQTRNYNKAFGALSAKEQTALHLVGRAADPSAYAKLLQAEKAAGHTVRPQTLALLKDPELQSLFDNPTQKMMRAHAEAVKLSDLNAAIKIKHGWMTPETAKEALYRHARVLSGAKFEEAAPAAEGIPGQLDIYGGHVPGHAAGRSGSGLAGGKSAEEIAAKLTAAGRPQPFYVPDVSVVSRKGLGSLVSPAGAGRGVVASPVKQSHLTLFRLGQLALHGDVMGSNFLRTVQKAYADDLHNTLISHGVRVSKGAPLDQGWVYLRRRVGKSSEKIAHTEQTLGDFERSFDTFAIKPGQDATGALEHMGNRVAVPERFVREVTGEFTRSNSVIKAVIAKPMAFWRAMILAVPPRFFVNNFIGNHLLYAIRNAGYAGVRGYLDAVKREHGTPMLRTLIKDRHVPPALHDKLMQDYFPEQSAQATFGATQRQGIASKFNPNARFGALPYKLARSVEKGKGGVIPATQAVAEGQVRRAAVMAGLRGSPEVKAVLRKMPSEVRDFETASRQALDKNPLLARTISDKVNDTLGDYLSFSSFERDSLRQLMPFYGWFKAITRVTAKMAVDTPGRTLLLTKIGTIGAEWTQKELGGKAPGWLIPFIPLSKGPGGTERVLGTGGMNPFQTIHGLGAGVGALAVGKRKEAAFQLGSAGLNPLLSELLSPRETQGGGVIGGALKNIGVSLPEARVLEAAFKWGQYSPNYRGKKQPYFQKNLRTELLAMLGYSEKQLNLSRIGTKPPSGGSRASGSNSLLRR